MMGLSLIEEFEKRMKKKKAVEQDQRTDREDCAVCRYSSSEQFDVELLSFEIKFGKIYQHESGGLFIANDDNGGQRLELLPVAYDRQVLQNASAVKVWLARFQEGQTIYDRHLKC
jgi:hypothetical protein